jgi:hypothetical protein
MVSSMDPPISSVTHGLSEQQMCLGNEALAGNAHVVRRQLRRPVPGLVVEIERPSQVAKCTVELGTKQKADAHVPVRDQLGLAIISAFRKLK